MGQGLSIELTQYDVEELNAYCGNVYDQREIEALYKRFRDLDKGKKGYISSEEMSNIPELSVNPFVKRLTRMFDNVNFREFARLVSAFSDRAPREAKIAFMFDFFDVDGDGVISRDDLELVVRQMVGQSLTDADIHSVVDRALVEGKAAATGIMPEQFEAAFKGIVPALSVEVPLLW